MVCCNSLPPGLSQTQIKRLQAAKNAASRTVTNARKLTRSRPFSDNFTGCPFIIAYTINFFLPHTCQFMEMLLSASLNFFISIPLLALSEELQDLSCVPRPRDSKTKRYGLRAFRYVAASLSNDSIQSFKTSLKTHF